MPRLHGALYSERGRSRLSDFCFKILCSLKIRYGPYKAKDIHAFIDFMDKLDSIATLLPHQKNDMVFFIFVINCMTSVHSLIRDLILLEMFLVSKRF